MAEAENSTAESNKAADMVADLDVGSRNPDNWQGPMLAAVGVLWALFHIYTASDIPFMFREWSGWDGFLFNSDKERSFHLAFALFLACTAFPLFKTSSRNRIPWYDWALALAGVAACMYLVVNRDGIADRAGLPQTSDLIMSAIGIIVVLVATYRALGLPMVIVASVFIVYVFFGDRDFMPEVIQWKGASFGKAMWHFWMQTEGVFGNALGVSASMVFLFVLFGSLLEKAGAGNYFIKVAFALMGHMRGGPAKAAVVSSAATGLISGSSIANVVTTGTFTIPLMKRIGFSPEKAGAVEVASSTNGQLTPPVMGAAAFLMIEYVGIPYIEVVKHAFLPAIISYIALVYIVHLEACKLGLEGLQRGGAPKTMAQRMMGVALGFAVFIGLSLAVYYGLGWLKPLLGDFTKIGMIILFIVTYLGLIKWAAGYPELEMDDPNAPITELPAPGPIAKTGYYFALPVVVLIWCLMVERFSPGLSAFWATLSMIFVLLTQKSLKAMFRGEGSDFMDGVKSGFADLKEGLINGSRNMIGIAVATGTAGIIIGTVSLTGAHQVIGELIEFISGGSLIMMLIFVALFSLVLGMGLPTTATYIVITSLMAQVIITVGAKSGLIVPLIAVHMFVFYFGIIADDTPPVGLAAFAAAAISKGDPIKTGLIGFSYDIRTAVLPFLFIFNTELLLINVGFLKAIFVFCIATIAMLLFAAATQGWFIARSRVWESVALLVIAFTLFNPGFWLDRVAPPYSFEKPTEMAKFTNDIPDGGSLRMKIEGEDFATDKAITTTIALPMGDKSIGDGAARLAKASEITFRTEEGKVLIDTLGQGKVAKALRLQGIDVDFEVKRLEIATERLPKEVFYIPAILLLLLIMWLQKRREPADRAKVVAARLEREAAGVES
jgi:TRAP transporter 4TM/12TM fusion protein